MNRHVVAAVVTEGSKILSEFFKLRVRKVTLPPLEMPPGFETAEYKTTSKLLDADPEQVAKEASSIEAGCVPCTLGHFGTCASLLSEAVRFARSDGIASPVPIDRMNKCLDELNAMERGDMTEAKLAVLPEWERTIATEALAASRRTRHGIEAVATVEQLEAVTAETQTAREKVGRAYYQEKIARMSPDDKAKLRDEAIRKIKDQEGSNE